MSGKTLIQIQNPVTQTVEAVKSLLTWRGRGTDPMPATVEFVQEGEGCMVLVLSNKKDSYYVVTSAKCSCPAATYHPGQPCKHQRKHFPQEQVATVATADSDSIRPEGKWPGGLNGPVDECRAPSQSPSPSPGRAQGVA
jgi:hypothetical protein